MSQQETTRRRRLAMVAATAGVVLIAAVLPGGAAQAVNTDAADPPLAGLKLDAAATQTTIRSMPFLSAEPGQLGQTRRTIGPLDETIPVGVTASTVYIAGMYNSHRQAGGSWTEHLEDNPFRDDQQYVGRDIGQLDVVYADGTSDRVQMTFGASAWTPWYGQLYEPFKSIPSARETLDRSLLLHRTGAEEPRFYLALQVPEKPIEKIVVRDDDTLRGRPVINGITLATADTGEHLQPFDAAGVAAGDREVTLDIENQGDWTEQVAALHGVLQTTEADLPDEVEPVELPDDVDATSITFLGGRDAGMLSNIWVANLMDMRAKFSAEDGFFHESAQNAPWNFWGGYGTWFENFGLYYEHAYARSAEHYAGLAMRNLHDDRRYTSFVDFVDHWLYYYRADHDPENGPPNDGLNGYPADAPPHWAYVLEAPQISGHNRNDIPGNEEMDGTCSTIVARWEAWRWSGRPADDWLTAPRDGVFGNSRWDSTRDATDFIPWLMDRYARNVVYSEGETTGPASPENFFQVYPNYTCLTALRASAEIADVLGESASATRWRTYADRIEAAMPAELTVSSPHGKVWKDSPTSTLPSQAHTLAPAWFAQHREGMDPLAWNAERAQITRNTFQREVNRFNGLVRPSGFGYGQGWLTQAALLLDEMDDAGVSLGNIARYSYDKNSTLSPAWEQWRWILPESAAVLPDGSWHRGGDISNGANQGEALRALEVAAGVDDTDPAELAIMPRIPEPLNGVDVRNARVMVADGAGTASARVSYRFDKSGGFHFESDRPVPSLAVRLGPFTTETEAFRAIRSGVPVGAKTEVVTSGTVAGGPAHWVWVRGLENVAELDLTLMDTIARASATLDVGPRLMAAGDVVDMAVSVRNNGTTPLRAVAANLEVPAGWTAKPQGPVRAVTLQPGAEFRAEYEVTVSPEQEPSTTLSVRGSVRYQPFGAPRIVTPLDEGIVVRSPVKLVSLEATPDVVQPGQSTTLRAVVRNIGARDVDGFLRVAVPDGWTAAEPDVAYRAAPGGETVVEAEVTNSATEGRSVTLSAQLTQGDAVRGEASVDVFTGRLRCLLGSSTREDWHHDDGFGCVLDEGFRFEDLLGRHWPADAPVRSCWAGNSRIVMHVNTPAGASGTLRLFIADPDNLSRRETITVEGRDLGTFESFRAGRWVDAPISAADTADGRIDVVVANARQGANAVVSIVEF